MTARRSMILQLAALALAIAMSAYVLPFLHHPAIHWVFGTANTWLPPVYTLVAAPLLLAGAVAASFAFANRGPAAKDAILALGVVAGLLLFEHGIALGSALMGFFSVRPLLALTFGFFAGISPIVARFEQNPWFGVRTPWTLGSRRVWRATHRATARLWLTGGIAGSALTMFGAPLSLVLLFLVVLVLAPAAISYRVWHKLGRP